MGRGRGGRGGRAPGGSSELGPRSVRAGRSYRRSFDRPVAAAALCVDRTGEVSTPASAAALGPCADGPLWSVSTADRVVGQHVGVGRPPPRPKRPVPSHSHLPRAPAAGARAEGGGIGGSCDCCTAAAAAAAALGGPVSAPQSNQLTKLR